MPEERRLTITSSPHLAPDDVARHTFASVRRGFDPTEVRDYLESLASGLRGLAEREQELRDALAAAEERAANPVIDDTMLTTAVGKETARVLQSAHDAAAEMVANAEAESTRLVSEAQAESERLLAEATEVNGQAHSRADALLAERTAEAEAAAASLQERTEQQVAAALDKVRADAEELTERARAEGRVMVEEAQQLRARVLADLSRRRKVLHAQIEQLRAGRERLAETITEVRHAVDAIAEDLFNAENEARLAAEVAGRELAGRSDDQTPEELAVALLAEEAASDDHATTTEARRRSRPRRPGRPVSRHRPSRRSTPCSPSCVPPRATRARPGRAKVTPRKLPPGHPRRRPPEAGPPRPNQRWIGTPLTGTPLTRTPPRVRPRPGTRSPCSVTSWWPPSSPACPVA